jgi:hypothetical protein
VSNFGPAGNDSQYTISFIVRDRNGAIHEDSVTVVDAPADLFERPQHPLLKEVGEFIVKCRLSFSVAITLGGPDDL